MKTRSQKLISLVLVLMMLVTMIPAGFFGASAVSAELDAALKNYSTTQEFVINSVEDWEAVAASKKSFDGRTVKLGADINAESGTLSTLFPNGFGGTFDGQNYTVKNATLTGTGDKTALITPYMATGAIRNVQFDTITVNSNPADDSVAAHVSLVLAHMSATYDITVENINAINININSTSTHADSAIAGVIAKITVNEATATATVKNINIQGLTQGSDGNLGGVVGTVAIGGTCKFENIHADMDLFDTDTVAASSGKSWTTAGVFAAKIETNTGYSYSLNNIYATGTLEGGHNNASIGGFVGFTSAPGAGDLATWSNIIVASTFVDIWGNNTVFANLTYGTITATNLATTLTTNGGNHNVNAQARWTVLCGGASGNVNGVRQEWTSGDNVASEVTKVSANVAAGMVQRDANGFITAITEPNPLDIALESFSTTSEFVINSVSDWNKIAAYSAANSATTWSGKTIKLGADIIGEVDGNGAPTTTLNILSPTQFYGTFDGNGKTIKNVKGGSTLFSNKIDGTTFKNVTFDNVVLTATGNYCGIFTTIVNNNGTATFSNITVKNTKVTAKAADSGMLCGIIDNRAGSTSFSDITITNSSLTGATHTGVLFGSLQTQAANTSLEIDGIKMDNVTVKNASVSALGGLIGWTRPDGTETTSMSITNVTMTNMKIAATSGYATGGLIGNMGHNVYNPTIENIIVTGSISHESTSNSSFVGGVFGRIATTGNVSVQKISSNMTIYGGNTGDAVLKGGFIGYAAATTGKLITFNDIYVGGSFTDTTTGYATMGGFGGRLAGVAGETNYNISNIVVDVTLPVGNSMTMFQVLNTNVILTKAYSTTENNAGTSSSVKSRWECNSYNDNSLVNGAFATTVGTNSINIDKKAATLMAKKDANGYVTGVYTTTVSALQLSAISNGRYAVRFIAFDFLGDATNVSMNVIAQIKDGIGKTFTSPCTMYTGLTAYHAQGITKTYEPGQFGAEMIAGFTIYNIPAEAWIDYTVTVTYTTADGTFSNVMTVSIANENGELKVIQ